MSCAIEEVLLRLGVFAPQHERDWIRLPGHCLDDGIREELPLLQVAAGRSLSDGQARVEKQYAISCPWDQRTVAVDWLAEVSLDFVQDVAKG